MKPEYMITWDGQGWSLHLGPKLVARFWEEGQAIEYRDALMRALAVMESDG